MIVMNVENLGTIRGVTKQLKEYFQHEIIFIKQSNDIIMLFIHSDGYILDYDF